MGITNQQVMTAIGELGDALRDGHAEQMQAIGAVEKRVGALEAQVGRMNGTVQRNVKDIDELPCRERGETLARVSAVVGLQPNPREAGATEATVKQGVKFRDRAWQIVAGVLALVLTIVLTAVLTGAI